MPSTPAPSSTPRGVKPNGYTRRRVRARGRRHRFFEGEARRAGGDPAVLLRVATRRVESAAAHTAHGDSDLRRLVDVVVGHARAVAAEAGMRPASVAHNERRLRAAATRRDQLAAALAWLRAAVAALPGEVRAARQQSYAGHLVDEAHRLLDEATDAQRAGGGTR